MLEPLAKLGIAVKRYRGINDRAEIDVRDDPAGADKRGARVEHRRFAQVPANCRQQGEPGQRLVKRYE
jgi:hypothetical protein